MPLVNHVLCSKEITLPRVVKIIAIFTLSRAPTQKRDGIFFYNFEYIFLVITIRKTCAR